MLPHPKRFVLIKLNHFLGIVETLGAELQTPPRLRCRYAQPPANGWILVGWHEHDRQQIHIRGDSRSHHSIYPYALPTRVQKK